MRADRLLSILFLLQAHRRMTARDLAQRLEVSERTIYRDMEALSIAGIPVYMERGTGGGCILLEEYRTNMVGLSEEEMRSLFLTNSSRLLGDLGLSNVSEVALLKLLSTLPSAARRSAEAARQRIHVDATGWFREQEAVPCLHTLQEAVWCEKKVQISYRRRDRIISERLVDPLGLVAKASMWYFVGGVDDTIRAYRVSRIQSATMTEQQATRPEGFDLASYWTAWCQQFMKSLPQYPVTARVAPELLPVLSQWYGNEMEARIERAGQPDEDGWIRLQFTFETKEIACGHIFSFGAQIEIVEPQELRDLMLERAASLVALYTQAREITHSCQG